MHRKERIIIILVGLISFISICIVDTYHQQATKISYLNEKITMQQSKEKTDEGQSDLTKKLTIDEACVSIRGIAYKENLSEEELFQRANELAQALAHQKECFRFCQADHPYHATVHPEFRDESRTVTVEGSDPSCQYIFTIKSQKDIHQNSYYELKLIAKKDMLHLDQLKEHANDLFSKWCIETTETICFTGTIDENIEKKDRELLVQQLFNHLNAAKTNYYEDEVAASTCSYYGYCPYIDEYYKEENGYRSNMQIAFNDNEIENETEIHIAFPFYNEVF